MPPGQEPREPSGSDVALIPRNAEGTSDPLGAGSKVPWRLLRMDPFSRVHAATWRGVMQVDLIKVLREPASSMSPCRRMKLCTFFEQAGLALCCEPRKVVRDMPVGPSS